MRNFLFGASVMSNALEVLVITMLWKRLAKVDPTHPDYEEEEED